MGRRASVAAWVLLVMKSGSTVGSASARGKSRDDARCCDAPTLAP